MSKDLAAYRTVGPVPHRVIRVAGGKVYVALDRKVGDVLSAAVGDYTLTIYERPSRQLIVFEGLPISFEPGAVLNLDILAEIDPTEGENILVPNTLGFSARTRLMGEREAAIQRAVRWLLMDKGSDVWHPSAGGGLRTLIKGVLLGGELTEITKRISLAVDDYNNQGAPRASGGGWRVRSIDVLAIREISPTKKVVSHTGKVGTQVEVGDEPAIGITLRHNLYNKGKTESLSSTVVL